MAYVTLTYTEHCDETGDRGWVLTHRNSRPAPSIFFASQSARTLTHDILEHWDYRQAEGNLQEIVALGTALAHRDDDLSILDGFAGDIAYQLGYVYPHPTVPDPTAHPAVIDVVNAIWGRVTQDLESPHTDLESLRNLTIRLLSRGYTHARTVDKRTRDYAFRNLFDTMHQILGYTLPTLSPVDSDTLRVYYSFQDCEVLTYHNRVQV